MKIQDGKVASTTTATATTTNASSMENNSHHEVFDDYPLKTNVLKVSKA
jgi:hypothetical protein